MNDLETYLNFAHQLADASAEVARSIWLGDLEVAYKEDGSSLTAADLKVEEIWREKIAAQFPEHSILGEEFGVEEGASAYSWALDPIDGTRQFGTGTLNFSSLISLCRDGIPVLGLMDMPLVNVRFAATAGQGTRMNGRLVQASSRETLDDAVVSLSNPDSFSGESAAVFERLRSVGRLRVFDAGSPVYGSVARGLVDTCVNGVDLDAFDICALCPIIQEAGGVITDWQGRALTLESAGGIVASSTARLHEAVLEKLA